MYESEHFTTFFPYPSRRVRLRDYGVSSMYIVTNPKGEVSPVPLESWNLRVLASGLQWNNRLRPDHIDDIDLVLAISILQQNGYDVQPAR